MSATIIGIIVLVVGLVITVCMPRRNIKDAPRNSPAPDVFDTDREF